MIFILIFSLIVNPLVLWVVSCIVPTIFIIVKKKKYSSGKLTAVAVSLLLVMLIVNSLICAAIANKPFVVIPEEYEQYFNDERISALQKDVSELYRGKAVLFPGIINVNYADYAALDIHVRYFFFGTVDFTVDHEGNRSIVNNLYRN